MRATASSRCSAGSAPGLAAYCSGGCPCFVASVASSKQTLRSAGCTQLTLQLLLRALGAEVPCRTASTAQDSMHGKLMQLITVCTRAAHDSANSRE